MPPPHFLTPFGPFWAFALVGSPPPLWKSLLRRCQLYSRNNFFVVNVYLSVGLGEKWLSSALVSRYTKADIRFGPDMTMFDPTERFAETLKADKAEPGGELRVYFNRSAPGVLLWPVAHRCTLIILILFSDLLLTRLKSYWIYCNIIREGSKL